MDETQRKLERQVAADPFDEDAVARLELMQIRSGMLVASDEGDGMVTTLLRQRVSVGTEARGPGGYRLFNPDDEIAGTIVAVYAPSIASRQSTTSSMTGIIGGLRVLVQIDSGRLIDIEARHCYIGVA